MANMTQCSQGHFYDTTKHSSCPWCGVGVELPGGSDAGKTRPMGQGSPVPQPPAGGAALPGPPPGVTRRIGPSGSAPPPPSVPSTPPSAPGATRRIADAPAEPAGFDPVVGWLVCIEGPDRGRDYRLRTAKNFIGRASSMDVCISGDDTVSRERHAVVAFEPEERRFWLLPGDAQGLVYLNGKVVHTPAELSGDDVVKVGQTRLMFVPFCGERHQW